jgi:hypothetical protein
LAMSDHERELLAAYRARSLFEGEEIRIKYGISIAKAMELWDQVLRESSRLTRDPTYWR